MKFKASHLGTAALISFSLSSHAATVIDNVDAGFTDHEANGYEQTTTAGNGFNGSVIVSPFVIDAPNTYLSWTFTGLDTTQVYDVAATWNLVYPGGNHTAAANYQIIGSTSIDVTVSHKLASTDDYVEADENNEDFNFEILGQVMPDANGTIVLELRDEDGLGLESPVADAALVNAVPEPSSALLLVAGGLLAIGRRKR
ncbi:PEP-CTERM sorting domain-containing protein [Verrucomicrobiaceae bacterium R5-34]|nr:PEP-CTERM sorting domain-containing protein [Verrucomicrobiaceae bacterium R5-34]